MNILTSVLKRDLRMSVTQKKKKKSPKKSRKPIFGLADTVIQKNILFF